MIFHDRPDCGIARKWATVGQISTTPQVRSFYGYPNPPTGGKPVVFTSTQMQALIHSAIAPNAPPTPRLPSWITQLARGLHKRGRRRPD